MPHRPLALLLLPVVLAAAAGQPDRPAVTADSPFGLDLKADRLVVTHGRRPVAEFVFDDPKILRPYLANVHGPNGTRVTRTHPPVPGTDATDHDTMHPGVWLAFGDVSGSDFWRNKGHIRHRRFLAAPTATKDRVAVAAEAELVSPAGVPLGTLVNRLTLTTRPAAWLLTWDATVRADRDRDLVFGDQEEMGFGTRVATELTEKKGGAVRTDRGAETAKAAWGQPAAWCDYAGAVGDRRAGVTLMAAPGNFRAPWWHVRDYGLAVANPFGRAALKQGPRSEVVIRRAESLRLVFGASFHDGDAHDPPAEYEHFLNSTR